MTVAYVCRLLPLTCLAPDIVERVMDGRPTAELARLLEPFPIEWEKQRQQFLIEGEQTSTLMTKYTTWGGWLGSIARGPRERRGAQLLLKLSIFIRSANVGKSVHGETL